MATQINYLIGDSNHCLYKGRQPVLTTAHGRRGHEGGQGGEGCLQLRRRTRCELALQLRLFEEKNQLIGRASSLNARENVP